MSEEKKEFDMASITPDDMQKIMKDKDADWSGDWWIWTFILMICFFGWGSHDATDHELRERVARLEGQMDMIRR